MHSFFIALCALQVAAPGAVAKVIRGYNSWDSFVNPDPHGNANESETLRIAEFMSATLLPHGFDTLTVDEGWYWFGGMQSTNASLDAFGRPSPRVDQYPSAAGGKGFAPLAAKLATLGLKMGVWTVRGIPHMAVSSRLPIAGSAYTADEAVNPAAPNQCSWNGACMGCALAPGGERCNDAALAYYASVAALYASWGVDYVKLDCFWGGPTPSAYDADLLAATGAFTSAGLTVSLSPGIGVTPGNISFLSSRGLASLSRVTGDLWDNWPALKSHIATAALFMPAFVAAEGNPAATLPDLDMLPIGDVRHGGVLSPSQLTADEQRLLVTLWSFCGAPLIMGGALPPSSNATLALLTNDAVLAMQGNAHGRRIITPVPPAGADAHAWTSVPDGTPAGGSAFLVLVNAADAGAAVGAALADAGLAPSGVFCATDLWSGELLPGRFAGSETFTLTLRPHAAAALRFETCSDATA